MIKKLIESIKAYTARDLKVLTNEQINRNLYPVNPMHSPEKTKKAEVRSQKPIGIEIKDIGKFRQDMENKHDQ